MIDFTKTERKKKGYGGANGNKISVVYDDKLYMLKFPARPSRRKDLNYTNSVFSEHIGSQIFKSIGIPTQNTLLGTYEDKIVVACEDFTRPGVVIQDFASMKNQVINSEQGGYGTELSDIEQTIRENSSLSDLPVLERFWDMFVVDSLIGNWDRHNGNWGFLYNQSTDNLILAPIFDCGSSLYPQADDNFITTILSSRKEMDFRIFEIPISAIKQEGEKINYFDFISSLKNKNLNMALKRIIPKIDIGKIYNIINSIDCISDVRKKFYITMLKERKERILDYSLNKLKEIEKSNNKNYEL